MFCKHTRNRFVGVSPGSQTIHLAMICSPVSGQAHEQQAPRDCHSQRPKDALIQAHLLFEAATATPILA